MECSSAVDTRGCSCNGGYGSSLWVGAGVGLRSPLSSLTAKAYNGLGDGESGGCGL